MYQIQGLGSTEFDNDQELLRLIKDQVKDDRRTGMFLLEWLYMIQCTTISDLEG